MLSAVNTPAEQPAIDARSPVPKYYQLREILLDLIERELTVDAPVPSERELAARYTVTGTLRVSGPEVRVTSRLVDTGTGAVLWAQSYEEDLRAKELFAIQEDIAQQVASGEQRITGVMIESNLVAGRQDVVPGEPLVYGQSITDGCIDWDTTVSVLNVLADAVSARRKAPSRHVREERSA